jgi:hypothetical protein
VSAVKKALIASMLAVFSAAVILPAVTSSDALAAGKKKTKSEKPVKKMPGKS